MWFEIDEGERINIARFREAEATGAGTIATGCSFCLIMMDDAAKVEGKDADIQVKDLAEIVAESL